MTILATDSGAIEYSRSGPLNSQTLLFVHGLGANQTQFQGERKAFDPAYQVLTLNLRGHGRSWSQEPFSLAACAQDILRLLDALGINRCHFVGNSLGGNVGYELLARHGHRLHSFTTFGTTAVMRTPKVGVIAFLLTYRLLPMSWLAAAASRAGQTRESQRLIKQMMLEAPRQTLLEIAPHLANFDFRPVIARSAAPALIIRGGKDAAINRLLPSTVAAFQKRGGFHLVDLPTAGHFANLDDPHGFQDGLQKFLQGLPSPTEECETGALNAC